MNSESVPAYMNVGKDFFCWAEAGGRRTKNEPISEEEKREVKLKKMDDGLTAQTSDKNYLHSGAIAANGSTVRAEVNQLLKEAD